MLDVADKRLLLALARERITAHLEGREENLPEPTPSVMTHAGGFVTLHSRVGKQHTLRGCIGHIDARTSIYETVKSVSYSAAFQDFRFPPLTLPELPTIEVEVSVISPFERVRTPEEITPGTHGLFISRGTRAGLLLPQVAAERNWDRETFLVQTCRKAGLPEDAWRDPETEISRFTAEVFDESSLAR